MSLAQKWGRKTGGRAGIEPRRERYTRVFVYQLSVVLSAYGGQLGHESLDL